MHRSLIGGRIQRLAVTRLAGREVAVLTVRLAPSAERSSPGQTVHVVVAGGLGVGVIDRGGCARLQKAAGNAASPSQAQWRRRVEGGRIENLGHRDISLVREGLTWCVSGEGTSLILAERAAAAVSQAAGATISNGARILEVLVDAGVAQRQELLRRALDKAIARLDRRIEAVEGDLRRSQDADSIAERASLFVAQVAQAPRGATTLEAIDWSSGEARRIEMPLDPSRGAKEQVDGLFKRARRLKEGAKISLARLADAKAARAALAAVVEALLARTNPAGSPPAPETLDLDSLEAQARKAAPRDFRLDFRSPRPTAARRHDQPARPPYRSFLGASGTPILVGRGAAHNDALTFHVSRPHDLWLHAKNRTGAHVIVQLDKGASCPADVLVEAAHLAAHFSEAREERAVEVQYVARRYLRKPRGSAPGFVVVDREKVIVLRREDNVIRRLLEAEVLR